MTDFELYNDEIGRFKFSKNKQPHTQQLSDGRTVVLVWNASEHSENRGWYINIFDTSGKRVLSILDNDRPKKDEYIDEWVLGEEKEELSSREWRKNNPPNGNSYTFPW